MSHFASKSDRNNVALKNVGATLVFTCCLLLALRYILNLTSTQDFLINEGLLPLPLSALTVTDSRSLGLQNMRNSKVAIVGLLGATGGGNIPKVLGQISYLLGLFGSSYVLLCLEPTTDPYQQVIRDWISNTIDHHQSDILMGASQLFGDRPREGRIAGVRNAALSHIRNKSDVFDYIIWVDLDVAGWDVNGIVDSFGALDLIRWDVMCAKGVSLHGVYRDVYAFRRSDINTNHHIHGSSKANSSRPQLRQTEFFLAYRNFSISKAKVQKLMAQTDGFIRSDSCFGGMSIYKYSKIGDCNYDYLAEFKPGRHIVECEHVTFNNCISRQNDAKIFTNPRMKLWYGHAISAAGIAMNSRKTKQFIALGVNGFPKQ